MKSPLALCGDRKWHLKTALSLLFSERSLWPTNKDFRGNEMQRIGGLVQEIEAIADPAVRAATKDWCSR